MLLLVGAMVLGCGSGCWRGRRRWFLQWLLAWALMLLVIFCWRHGSAIKLRSEVNGATEASIWLFTCHVVASIVFSIATLTNEITACPRLDERTSKNKSYSLKKYNEEQFRKTYHNYETDFILTVKQYLRHMAPEGECSKPDLFMQAISSPLGNIWYNRVHKVARDTSGKRLKNMLILVGLPGDPPGDLFSNRSGRATLITRMAAKGVPDEVGMLITGHHTTGGYSRYDRTPALKMEVASLVSANPGLDYVKALAHVSKQFLFEELVGSSAGLKPLIENPNCDLEVALVTGAKESNNSTASKLLDASANNNQNRIPFVNDGVDWELELSKFDPALYSRMTQP